jgi:hypothetical protein
MAKRNYAEVFNNNYPSVTEALGVLRKIGLEMWFKYNTAKFCDEKSAKGKEIGTQIHDLIQRHIELNEMRIETQYPEEVTNAVKSFLLFKKENPLIKLTLSEVMGVSEKYQFNFTIDCVGSENGIEIVADWKTGECKKEDKPKIYDEYLYQVSAYVYGYNESKKTDIKRAYIVAFAKDKIAYNIQWLNEQEIKECFEEAFLPALKICKFQKGRK